MSALRISMSQVLKSMKDLSMPTVALRLLNVDGGRNSIPLLS